MTTANQQFASDNYSGVCPEAWEAMARANQGHDRAYGDDQWTARAADHFRALFDTDCEVFSLSTARLRIPWRSRRSARVTTA